MMAIKPFLLLFGEKEDEIFCCTVKLRGMKNYIRNSNTCIIFAFLAITQTKANAERGKRLRYSLKVGDLSSVLITGRSLAFLISRYTFPSCLSFLSSVCSFFCLSSSKRSFTLMSRKRLTRARLVIIYTPAVGGHMIVAVTKEENPIVLMQCYDWVRVTEI